MGVGGPEVEYITEVASLMPIWLVMFCPCLAVVTGEGGREGGPAYDESGS